MLRQLILVAMLSVATISAFSVEPKKLWTTSFLKERQFANGVAASNGAMYVASNGTHFAGINTTTGNVSWVTKIGSDGSIIVGTLYSGSIVIGTVKYGSGTIAVDASSGKIRWYKNDRNDFGIHSATFWSFTDITSGAENFAYVDGYNRVMVRDGRNGTLMWHSAEHLSSNGGMYFLIGNPSNPVIVLPAPPSGGMMTGFNASTGSILWTRNMSYNEAPVRAATSDVVVVGWDRNIGAISFADGKHLWSRDLTWKAMKDSVALFSPGAVTSSELFLKYVHAHYAGSAIFERIEPVSGNSTWVVVMKNTSDIRSVVSVGQSHLYTVIADTTGNTSALIFDRLSGNLTAQSKTLNGTGAAAKPLYAFPGSDEMIMAVSNSKGQEGLMAVDFSGAVAWEIFPASSHNVVAKSTAVLSHDKIIVASEFFSLHISAYQLTRSL